MNKYVIQKEIIDGVYKFLDSNPKIAEYIDYDVIITNLIIHDEDDYEATISILGEEGVFNGDTASIIYEVSELLRDDYEDRKKAKKFYEGAIMSLADLAKKIETEFNGVKVIDIKQSGKKVTLMYSYKDYQGKISRPIESMDSLYDDLKDELDYYNEEQLEFFKISLEDEIPYVYITDIKKSGNGYDVSFEYDDLWSIDIIGKDYAQIKKHIIEVISEYEASPKAFMDDAKENNPDRPHEL